MTYRCCICGKEFEGYGNNPWPLMADNARCCDKCNLGVVIPARISQLKKGSPTKEEMLEHELNETKLALELEKHKTAALHLTLESILDYLEELENSVEMKLNDIL